MVSVSQANKSVVLSIKHRIVKIMVKTTTIGRPLLPTNMMYTQTVQKDN